jgi:hypothetical protein
VEVGGTHLGAGPAGGVLCGDVLQGRTWGVVWRSRQRVRPREWMGCCEASPAQFPPVFLARPRGGSFLRTCRAPQPSGLTPGPRNQSSDSLPPPGELATSWP